MSYAHAETFQIVAHQISNPLPLANLWSRSATDGHQMPAFD